MENPSTRLYQILSSLRQESASGHHFVSYVDLKRSVTQTLVSDVIDGFDYPEHRRFMVVARILEEGLRVFAILIWMHDEEQICHFLEHNELDSRLPMEEGQVHRIAPQVRDQFWKEVQWEFLPHEFRMNDGHRIIQDRVILPFLEDVKQAEGASGEISKCTIAFGQQTLLSENDTTSLIVVRKRLKMIKSQEATDKAFRREMECLEVLRCLRHDNIIQLLGSYTHKGEHNLLFPSLPQDLASFLQLDERFGEFRENLTFYDALSGLASAVGMVHNVVVDASNRQSPLTRIGYHHDIRPKNILVTSSTFILADFGLARFKPANEDSKTRWKTGVGDYIAPECMDENFDRKKVGRSIDIWSLGCLIAEIATYMEGGPSHVKKFREERERSDLKKIWTNNYFFEKETLNVSVSRWLTMLSANPKDRGVRCLVEAARVMLQVNHEDRPKIARVSRILSYIHIKALFRLTDDAFQKTVTTSKLSSRETPPYGRLNLWFEAERFKAWGIVLGMYTDQIDCALFKENASMAVSLRIVLEKLHPKLRSYTLFPSNEIASRLSDTVLMRTPFDEDVRKQVQELWEAVPLVYQERMEQVWRQSLLDTEDSAYLNRIEEDAPTLNEPFSGIGVHAAMRRLEHALWKESETTSSQQKKLILRDAQIERIKTLGQDRELAWYRPIQQPSLSLSPVDVHGRQCVLIEWMLYSPIWAGQSDEQKVIKVAALTELLHGPKPKGFHVLNCLGVLPPTEESNHEGFGFVYSFPSDIIASLEQEPRTLLEFIQKKDYTMLLEERFHIAKSLIRSLYELHSAGWLHKNIQSCNILFFPQDSSDTWNAARDPFLIGFRHSRPDGEVWYSDTDKYNNPRTDYHHPDYKPSVTRFQKAYDYYSVGVILLELGFYQPISAFRAQHKLENEKDFRRLLITKYAPKLGAKMGSLYRDVVVACLTGDFSEIEEERETSDDLAGFFWNVVAKLSECHVG
ncbi:MAG: hypothetical protein Q9187_004957 [Circinaria calcarea]